MMRAAPKPPSSRAIRRATARKGKRWIVAGARPPVHSSAAAGVDTISGAAIQTDAANSRKAKP